MSKNTPLSTAEHSTYAQLRADIERIIDGNAFDFEQTAISLFRYQAANNVVYARYLQALKKDTSQISKLEQIPFLPIDLFKTFEVKSGEFEAEIHFTSSGTTNSIASKHAVRSLKWYEKVFESIFTSQYGPASDWVIIGLLPAYLERTGSSLIYMVDHLIKKSGQIESGFFLNDYVTLKSNIQHAHAKGKKVLLLGVSFALLDLAEKGGIQLKPTDVLMETGGMKGRRKEIIREELHQQLKMAFGIKQVHSEYGMTELLSQAYASADGLYSCPAWMQVLIRDTNDPLSYIAYGRGGGINIVDLANIDSCAFIQTQDLGKIHPSGQFEVLGRFDQSDIRGCNLLVG